VLYRVVKPGVRQAKRGGGFVDFEVGDPITCSAEGAAPLLRRGFIEIPKAPEHEAPAAEAVEEVPNA
jgi:hypothetical protein